MYCPGSPAACITILSSLVVASNLLVAPKQLSIKLDNYVTLLIIHQQYMYAFNAHQQWLVLHQAPNF